MKSIRITIITLLLVVVSSAYAKETEFVSKTFQEIQSRVLSRDEHSGAILKVKILEDAPRLNFGLNFSITEDAGDVVIILSRNLKAGDGVYEKYRLRMDDSLRQELDNQKLMIKLRAERQKTYIKNQKKKITELTEGNLKMGMSPRKVKKIKGKAAEIQSAAEFGSSTWIYPDMLLRFVRGSLYDVELTE
ncbi:hypothetical protein P0Y35_17730 [Kiritimatiellaeota bacterium B1221]|nr:hypothetical protein [Kiritimatiellaeota bacterium B1221]